MSSPTSGGRYDDAAKDLLKIVLEEVLKAALVAAAPESGGLSLALLVFAHVMASAIVDEIYHDIELYQEYLRASEARAQVRGSVAVPLPPDGGGIGEGGRYYDGAIHIEITNDPSTPAGVRVDPIPPPSAGSGGEQDSSPANSPAAAPPAAVQPPSAAAGQPAPDTPAQQPAPGTPAPPPAGGGGYNPVLVSAEPGALQGGISTTVYLSPSTMGTTASQPSTTDDPTPSSTTTSTTDSSTTSTTSDKTSSTSSTSTTDSTTLSVSVTTTVTTSSSSTSTMTSTSTSTTSSSTPSATPSITPGGDGLYYACLITASDAPRPTPLTYEGSSCTHYGDQDYSVSVQAYCASPLKGSDNAVILNCYAVYLPDSSRVTPVETYTMPGFCDVTRQCSCTEFAADPYNDLDPSMCGIAY